MNTNLLSFSGGIDSTTLLLEAIKKKDRIKLITFDYGQTRSELEQVNVIINYLGLTDHIIIDISKVISINPNSIIIPNRNSIFINILWAHALLIEGAVNITIGATGTDYKIFPDCREEFFYKIEKVLNLANPSKIIKIKRPFIDFKKSMVIIRLIALCKDLKIDHIVLLRMTHSSYEDRIEGKSLFVQERATAFKELGMIDPLEITG